MRRLTKHASYGDVFCQKSISFRALGPFSTSSGISVRHFLAIETRLAHLAVNQRDGNSSRKEIFITRVLRTKLTRKYDNPGTATSTKTKRTSLRLGFVMGLARATSHVDGGVGVSIRRTVAAYDLQAVAMTAFCFDVKYLRLDNYIVRRRIWPREAGWDCQRSKLEASATPTRLPSDPVACGCRTGVEWVLAGRRKRFRVALPLPSMLGEFEQNRVRFPLPTATTGTRTQWTTVEVGMALDPNRSSSPRHSRLSPAVLGACIGLGVGVFAGILAVVMLAWRRRRRLETGAEGIRAA